MRSKAKHAHATHHPPALRQCRHCRRWIVPANWGRHLVSCPKDPAVFAACLQIFRADGYVTWNAWDARRPEHLPSAQTIKRTWGRWIDFIAAVLVEIPSLRSQLPKGVKTQLGLYYTVPRSLATNTCDCGQPAVVKVAFEIGLANGHGGLSLCSRHYAEFVEDETLAGRPFEVIEWLK